ncbi:hypothetical protein [Catalinimonas niigatensis]|uniref:hypothetical protein n=1 Tax=Catalinimonas niigatensis TaxID=1397264 RepID=UPI0026667858|nr:hypothetical protein [Catalinimonas niigatensis]WPP51745.1 hypothetical protein PZB72_05010 [Catalinimonas niigatensis]
MKQKKFWNADKMVSIAAMIVSVGSLFVIIYQTNLIRTQQYASVLPYLTIGFERSDGQIRITLMNNGLGPAFIKDIRMQYEGQMHHKNMISLYREFFAENGIEIFTQGISVGEVITVNEKIVLIGVSEDLQSIHDFVEYLGSGDSAFAIEYASVYEERWEINDQTNVPVKLE